MESSRQTDGRADRQAGRQTDRWTDRQRDKRLHCLRRAVCTHNARYAAASPSAYYACQSCGQLSAAATTNLFFMLLSAANFEPTVIVQNRALPRPHSHTNRGVACKSKWGILRRGNVLTSTRSCTKLCTLSENIRLHIIIGETDKQSGEKSRSVA